APMTRAVVDYFFFAGRRRHTRFSRDWSQTCALPILQLDTELFERVGIGLVPVDCLADAGVQVAHRAGQRVHLNVVLLCPEPQLLQRGGSDAHLRGSGGDLVTRLDEVGDRAGDRTAESHQGSGGELVQLLEAGLPPADGCRAFVTGLLDGLVVTDEPDRDGAHAERHQSSPPMSPAVNFATISSAAARHSRAMSSDSRCATPNAGPNGSCPWCGLPNWV